MQWSTSSTLLVAWGCLSLVSGCTDEGEVPADDVRMAVEIRVGALVEAARIDGYAEALVPIRGIAVYEDGQIAIGQPQDSQVRWFDQSGSAIGKFGSRGQGPGEFEGIISIGLRADTLWVFDPVRRRTSFVHRTDGMLRTESMPDELEAAGEVQEVPLVALPVPVAIGTDDFLYVTFAFPGEVEQPPLFRDNWVIGRMSSQGVLDRIVAQAPQGTIWVRTANGSAQVPFPNRGLVTASQGSDRFAAAFAPLEGDDAGTIMVSMWDREGAKVWSRRHPVDLRSLPAAVADSAIQARSRELQNPELRDALREYRPPGHYPPLMGLVIGTDGTTWVGLDEGDSNSLYVVFDQTGKAIGRVMIPQNGRVAAADSHAVWVIEKDDLEVESLVRYFVEWR